jgi:hypothetical protein
MVPAAANTPASTSCAARLRQDSPSRRGRSPSPRAAYPLIAMTALMLGSFLGLGGCRVPDRSSPSQEAPPQTPAPSSESPPPPSLLKPAAQWNPYRERTSESLAAVAQRLDSDGDRFVNAVDNCPDAANPAQSDKDKDGYGDVCDPGDPVPLTLRLTSPRSGARVATGANIRLAAAITTPQSSVGGIRFVATDVAAGASWDLATREQRPYEFTWTDAMPGCYRLRAEAWDEDGNESQSQTVTIVVGDTGPPPPIRPGRPDLGAASPAPVAAQPAAPGSSLAARRPSARRAAALPGAASTSTSEDSNEPLGELTAEAAARVLRAVDSDADGLSNAEDNCPHAPNPDQRDNDRDGFGDACDPGPAAPPVAGESASQSPTPEAPPSTLPEFWVPDEYSSKAGSASAALADPDGDGIPSARDNCAAVANPGQVDTDGDGYGDACDPGPARSPEVRLTAPADAARLSLGRDVVIEAEATDQDGYVLEVRVAALQQAAPHAKSIVCRPTRAPFRCTWKPHAAGAYSLTAFATDDGGATKASPPIRVIVDRKRGLSPVTSGGDKRPSRVSRPRRTIARPPRGGSTTSDSSLGRKHAQCI